MGGLSSPPHGAKQKKKQGSADEACDDRRDPSGADVDVQDASQPAANEGSDDADNNVADQAEAAALDECPGKPASDSADNQPSQQTVSFHFEFILQRGTTRPQRRRHAQCK